MQKARHWIIEVRYMRPARGATAVPDGWLKRSDPMTLAEARRELRKRADYERWQEDTAAELGTAVDNSDRMYRLRNVDSEEIITEDRLRFIFGARPTAANTIRD